MAQLIDIQRVDVGRTSLVARVRVADTGPLMTSDDLQGTTRVYRLMPHIIDHVCLGDASDTFKDVMGYTELPHLLEHMTVELLAQTNIAGDISTGRTWRVEGDDRTFEIELACPDDVLVAAALSSASWIMEWAYSGGGKPEPDIDGIVKGLVDLVGSLPEPEPMFVERVVVEEDPDEIPEPETAKKTEPEPVAAPAPVVAPAPAPEPARVEAPAAAPTLAKEPGAPSADETTISRPVQRSAAPVTAQEPEPYDLSEDDAYDGDVYADFVAQGVVGAAAQAEDVPWDDGFDE